MDVLVTGAEERQGLAVIRALGSYGLSVCATGLKKDSLGFYSRYAKETIQYPSPISQKSEFVDTGGMIMFQSYRFLPEAYISIFCVLLVLFALFIKLVLPLLRQSK